MTAQQRVVRGIAPVLYGVLNLSHGIAQGLVTVTLAYVLAQRGFSVASIAGLESLWFLPLACRVVIAPVLDLSLTPTKWCVICIAALSGGMLAFNFVRLEAGYLLLIATLILTMSAAAAAATICLCAAMALTTPSARRGAVAGWMTAGNLGGTGLGGGLGLWVTVHAGGLSVATLAMALVSLASALPLVLFRLPARRPATGLPGQSAVLIGALVGLARSRDGVLAMIMAILPVGLGAAAGLMPAVAGDWRASADLVAGVTGVLGGLVVIPGAIVGGYICDRFPRRPTYIWVTFAYAVAEVANALAPHSPETFTVFVLLNAFLFGMAFAALSAVILDCLGLAAPGTVSALLTSMGNIPNVAGLALIGLVQTRYGSTAMLLAEAGVAAIFLALYASLTVFWRQGSARLVASSPT